MTLFEGWVALANDFPLLMRVWFVLLGCFFISALFLKGQWYFRRTHLPAPRWLVLTFLLVAGAAMIALGLFGHVSR
jgi:hypothetical protein